MRTPSLPYAMLVRPRQVNVGKPNNKNYHQLMQFHSINDPVSLKRKKQDKIKITQIHKVRYNIHK
jgi:hypothetical protein